MLNIETEKKEAALFERTLKQKRSKKVEVPFESEDSDEADSAGKQAKDLPESEKSKPASRAAVPSSSHVRRHLVEFINEALDKDASKIYDGSIMPSATKQRFDARKKKATGASNTPKTGSPLTTAAKKMAPEQVTQPWSHDELRKLAHQNFKTFEANANVLDSFDVAPGVNFNQTLRNGNLVQLTG